MHVKEKAEEGKVTNIMKKKETADELEKRRQKAISSAAENVVQVIEATRNNAIEREGYSLINRTIIRNIIRNMYGNRRVSLIFPQVVKLLKERKLV